MLQRIRELAVQYGNGTLSTSNQAAIQSEVNTLISGVEQLGTGAQFNGIYLLNAVTTLTFQVGANDGDKITVAAVSLNQLIAPIIGGPILGTPTTMSSIDAAINAVSGAAATFGAVQNRLQYSITTLSTYDENLASANSEISDVDMAAAVTNMTGKQILEQSGVAMLAQAQKDPQIVLTLLQH
jgi:flagellin